MLMSTSRINPTTVAPLRLNANLLPIMKPTYTK